MADKWVFPDPVFGPTVFSGTGLKLIKTAEVTRLYDIMQLSTASIFFTAATHSRFQHSLGMARLVKDFLINILAENPEIISLLVYSSILHDIGHPGWGHAGELFMEYRGVTIQHSDISSRLVEGDPQLTQYFTQYALPLVSEVLDDKEKKLVSKLISGKAPIFTGVKSEAEVVREEKEKRYLGQIISHRALDFDRLEYLIRDAFYTATSASFFKLKDVFENLRVEEVSGVKELVFGTRDFAESFILTRELMYSGVYQHSENLVAREMLARAFNLCFDQSEDPYEIWFKTDQQLWEGMYSNNESKNIARLIKNRQIYEITYQNNFFAMASEVTARLKKLTKQQILHVEEELAQPELKPSQLILCIYVAPEPHEKDCLVVTETGRIEPLRRISPLVRGMNDDYRDSRSKVVFAVDPGMEGAAKQIALSKFKDYFNIPS